LSKSLALAFQDEAASAWLLPDASTRATRLERVFRSHLATVYVPLGHTWTIEPEQGAAVWCPPGRWRTNFLREAWILPATLWAYRGGLLRLFRSAAQDEMNHPDSPPHWYLALLGVAPDWQGQGIGSALLRPVLQTCDEHGAPAYLETLDARARALYERAGFRVSGRHTYPGSGLDILRMWREPARGSGS
jgi:GNAT superfamily N-acetyltransferase